MGKNIRKTRHQASRAVDRSIKTAKDEILNFYRQLGKKKAEKRDLDREFLESGQESISVPAIIEQLRSSSPDLLISALRILERIGDMKNIDLSKVQPLVRRILRTNTNAKIRYEAAKTISKMRDTDAIEDLVRVIHQDRSETVKEGAVKALGFIKADICFDLLVNLLSDIWDQSIRVRKAAAFSLGRLDPSISISILCDSLVNDPDQEVRKEAAESIAICLLKLDKEQVSTVAKTISTQLNHETEKEHEVRISVINAMTVAEDTGCLDELIYTLKSDPHERVRGQAANALAHYFDPRVEKALIESLDSEKGGVKKRIALALAHYAMKNPLGLHDEVCNALIYIQKYFPKGSYIWKEAVKALPAC